MDGNDEAIAAFLVAFLEQLGKFADLIKNLSICLANEAGETAEIRAWEHDEDDRHAHHYDH